MLLKKFFPKKVARSVYYINFKKYYNKLGYRGILFDIDNTLVPHGEKADEKAVSFFKRLEGIGFKFCLISNNSEERVKPFADAVGAPYIFDAHKPSVNSYNKAMELMGTDIDETLFVGDQVFTDVFGGNRANMYTILVRPIHPKEEFQIVLKRRLERIVMWRYARQDRKKLGMEKKQYDMARLLRLKKKREKV